MKKGTAQVIKLERRSFIRKAGNFEDSYTYSRKPLAAGSYGTVHLCTNKVTRETRIVKIVPKFKMENVESFLNEIEMLKLVVIASLTSLRTIPTSCACTSGSRTRQACT